MTEDTSPAHFILPLLIIGTTGIIFTFLSNSIYEIGKTEGTNLTTIECVKEPKKCEIRYDYLMMIKKENETH